MSQKKNSYQLPGPGPVPPGGGGRAADSGPVGEAHRESSPVLRPPGPGPQRPPRVVAADGAGHSATVLPQCRAARSQARSNRARCHLWCSARGATAGPRRPV